MEFQFIFISMEGCIPQSLYFDKALWSSYFPAQFFNENDDDDEINKNI